MGSFVVYALEWALCLSVFLLLYKMCFSGSTFHRFNRLFLLGSVVLSALLPLIHITTTEQMEPIAEVCRVNTMQYEPIEISTLDTSNLSPLASEPSLTSGQKIFLAIALIYFLYIAIQTIGWLRSLVKMVLFLRGKRTRKVGRWIRLVNHSEQYGPFSWMNYIVISYKENGFARRASMHHELSHIRLLHPLDLVFVLLCTLVNPVCWLIMKEIKVVHEYEADDEVINHYHIRSRDYQRLLIMRTVGAEAYALACSFNLNIKKRIIMMKKQQSHWWRMMWIAVTVPLVGIALTAFSKPKEALKEVVDSSVEVIEQPIVEALTTEVEEPEIIETPAPVKEVKEVNKTEEVKAGDKVSGTVKDEKGTLFGANVVEIDGYGRIVGNAITDANGNFTLKVKNPENKIRVSFVGLKTKTVDITSNNLEIKLDPNTVISPIQVTGVKSNINSDDPRYKDNDVNSGDDNTFNLMEQAPSFPGGQGEIMKYLSTHLRYPTVAREMQVEAEVTVKFIVDKTGLVRSPKAAAVKSNLPANVLDLSALSDDKEDERERAKAFLDAVESLREEAVYVVRNMPRWEPGRQNGKRVETSYTLPINFKLAQ